MKRMTGRELNRKWCVKAQHALYREDVVVGTTSLCVSLAHYLMLVGTSCFKPSVSSETALTFLLVMK